MACGIALAAAGTAEARQGCGPGGHRSGYGHCRPNRGPIVASRPGGVLIIGRHYPGRGYWDGRRYWQQRYRHNNRWRYR
jgi:hypothetical protein